MRDAWPAGARNIPPDHRQAADPSLTCDAVPGASARASRRRRGRVLWGAVQVSVRPVDRRGGTGSPRRSGCDHRCFRSPVSPSARGGVRLAEGPVEGVAGAWSLMASRRKDTSSKAPRSAREAISSSTWTANASRCPARRRAQREPAAAARRGRARVATTWMWSSARRTALVALPQQRKRPAQQAVQVTKVSTAIRPQRGLQLGRRSKARHDVRIAVLPKPSEPGQEPNQSLDPFAPAEPPERGGRGQCSSIKEGCASAPGHQACVPSAPPPPHTSGAEPAEPPRAALPRTG